MTSFRNRMFLIIVGLVLGIEAITMWAALRALESDALENSARGLQVGERVFRELLATRESQLATAVRVLADDFGFKEAVATADIATLRSALANHGNRIDADLVAFVQPDGTIAASTHSFGDEGAERGRFPNADLLVTEGERTAARTVVLPDGVFQMVVAPVYAPRHVGWVSTGFEVDDALAAALKELTNLEVTFLSAAADGHTVVPGSTLAPADRSALAGAPRTRLPGADAPGVFGMNGTQYLSLTIELATGQRTALAVLQRSLPDALAGYYRLLEQMFAIFVGTVLLAVVAARLAANGVTQPLSRLADAARRIAGGSYGRPVDVERSDEIGVLAGAFNEMQEGLAEREQRILYQSRHDSLTNLPNRLALHESIAAALRRAARHRRAGAILLIDVLGFKALNDTFGHDTGDEALRALGARLAGLARGSDVVARYGGNCFVIVVEETSADDARALGDRIIEMVGEPIALARTTVRLDLTIGTVLFPEHGNEADMLLRRAEIAMYKAREHGAASAFYEAGQDERHLRRLELIKELTAALEADALEVVYQPKLDLATGEVAQAEALVRWTHAELGPIAPAEFVPIAEQSGLVQSLTAAVLRKVVEQIRDWSAAGIDIVVSANISTVDLADERLPEHLTALTASRGVRPDRLRLEVTESALMRDPESMVNVLERLQSSGFELSIDDFGTGYSSLVQLKQMPVTELKIDRSFVAGLPGNVDDAVIVRSTIELAHNLGLSVVAEGAETEQALSFLRAERCDFAQGYVICRPLPPADFAAWLARLATGRAAQRRDDEAAIRPGGPRVAFET